MTRSAQTGGDRRVLRTRESLRAAFVALMAERGWDRVSVQDICDRANVGRSTFYTHFADKEELVSGGLEDLRRALVARGRAETAVAAQPLGFVRGLIEHAHDQRRLFRAVVGRRSAHFVQSRFRKMVLGLVEEDLAHHGFDAKVATPLAHFVAGALIELLTWWLEHRDPMTPEQLEALLFQLIRPVLTSARSRG